MSTQHARQNTKSIVDINQKLQDGSAVVMTAMEFKSLVRQGKTPSLDDVDVVTTATRAVMSGTAAMLTVELEGARAEDPVREFRINGVPCLAQTADDSAEGRVEVMLNGTQESEDNEGRYGGGHVLRALVERQ